MSPPLLVVTGMLLQELLSRIGAGTARLAGHRPGTALEAYAVSWLAGILLLGTAFLGLALAGIFYPAIVATVAAALVVAGNGLRPALLQAAARELRLLPARWLVLLVPAALALVAVACSPSVDEDSLVYHLALPWQCLMLHRFPMEHVVFVLHLPLPVDLAYAVPILLGDDRLAKWMMAGAFGAAGAFMAGRGMRTGDTSGGLLAPLVALSAMYSFAIPSVPKNDAVAAACLVAGAFLWRANRGVTGALLLGGVAAAKLTAAPFAAAWVLLHPPRWRRMPLAGILLLLPTAPWLAKNWFALGDPLFPVLWKHLPSPFWGALNQEALRDFQMWVPDAASLRTLPAALVRSMWQEFPLFLLALPLLAVAGRIRSSAAILLGFLGALFGGGLVRYLVPGIWLEAAEMGAVAGAIPGPRGQRTRAALAAACLVLTVHTWKAQPLDWKGVLRGALAGRRASLTTYGDSASSFRALRESGPATPRILLAGGWRSYLLPCRPLFNGFWGETPAVWSAVRESPSEERLRRRFRQLGCRAVLMNFVSADLVSNRTRHFAWDGRMLGLYTAFCRHRLRALPAPARADRANGGFRLMELDLTPAPARRDSPVFFLPTAESAILLGRMLTISQRLPEARREFERIMALAPGVAHFTSHYAEVFGEMGQWERAYRLLVPFARLGHVDNYNLPRLGAAAVYTRRYDEAIAVIGRCISLYDTVNPNRVNLSWAWREKANTAVAAGRLAEAGRYIDSADRVMAVVPPDPTGFYEVPRRQVIAEILGTRADILRASGRASEARELYRQAIEAAPELPEAAGWGRSLQK